LVLQRRCGVLLQASCVHLAELWQMRLSSVRGLVMVLLLVLLLVQQSCLPLRSW